MLDPILPLTEAEMMPDSEDDSSDDPDAVEQSLRRKCAPLMERRLVDTDEWRGPAAAAGTARVPRAAAVRGELARRGEQPAPPAAEL
jgi:hypothetical protein